MSTKRIEIFDFWLAKERFLSMHSIWSLVENLPKPLEDNLKKEFC